MKRRKIVLSLALALLLLALMPAMAMAATESKDGIDVTVSTDKTDYAAGDTVQVNVEITNSGTSKATGVMVDIVLPDGLSLAQGYLSYSLGDVAPGATWKQSISTIADKPASASPVETAPTANVTTTQAPKTGDTSTNIWFLIAVALGAVVALGLLIYKKKKRAIKLMSVIFCLLASVCLIAPSLSMAAGSISVGERITVDGVEKMVTVNVSTTSPLLYAFNTPATVQHDGWDVSVDYDLSSPQPAGTEIRPTISFANGTNTRSYRYELRSATLGKTLASGTIDTAIDDAVVCAPFTTPANDVQDIELVLTTLYAFNTPATVQYDGWDVTVSYDLPSPQPAGTEITPTITLTNGEIEDVYDYKLSSAILGGVFASGTVNTAIEDAVVCAPFTMPANDVQDIELVFPTCFTADTLVMTNVGEKRIAEIKENDMVWSWNEKTGEYGYNRVTKLHVHENISDLWYIEADGKTIETTSVHPFYVEGKGFIKAGEISSGEYLLGADGQKILVSASYAVTLKEPVTVYNITVEEANTYYAGGVLVHNVK